jgi:small ubiquitin-related modifier
MAICRSALANAIRGPNIVSIKVRGQDGTEVFFKLRRDAALRQLKEVWSQRQGGAPWNYRFIFDGNRIENHATPDDLEMEDDDVIDGILEQTGDMGVLAQHNKSPGIELLAGNNSTAEADADAVAKLVRQLHGRPDSAPQVLFRPALLPAVARQQLIRTLNMAHAKSVTMQGADLKLEPSLAELEATIGKVAVAALVAQWDAAAAVGQEQQQQQQQQQQRWPPFNQIKLRRTEAISPAVCIGFHTDHSERTMQVPLNSPAEYEGGQLVFATSNAVGNGGRLVQPSRELGSVTIHDNGVVHGVTPLVAGVRYGLFLLRVPEVGR